MGHSFSVRGLYDHSSKRVLFFILAFMLMLSSDSLVCSAASGASQALIGKWNFDDGAGKIATDLSGHNNDATVNGASWADGISGKALRFDGIDDFVDVGNLDVSGSELTITFWAKADSFIGRRSDNRLISKSTGEAADDHYWMVSTYKDANDNASQTRLRFRLKTGTNSQRSGTTTLIVDSSLGTIDAGAWFHAAVTYDGSTMKIYQNGVEVASTAKTGNIGVDPAVGVNIGRNPDGDKPWDGLIDEVMIYNRALLGDEIQSIAGVPQNDPPVNVNRPPIADSKTINVEINDSVKITLTGSDPDNDALEYFVISEPANGSLTGTPPNLTYSPDPEFLGQDSFTFISDDGEFDSASALVSIDVIAFDNGPTANDDSATTNTLTPAKINVLANDLGVDGDTLVTVDKDSDLGANLDVTSNMIAYDPSGSSVLQDLGSGDFDYDTFIYTIENGQGSTSSAMVEVKVTGVGELSGYYVAPNGSNNNSGTKGKPWKTLKFALSQLTPGDTLFLRGGTYNEGEITFDISGTKSNPITIKNFPGENPVIDGGYPEFRTIGNNDWELVDAKKHLYKSKKTYSSPGNNLHGKFENNGKLYALLPYKRYSSLTSSTEDVNSGGVYYAGPGIYWNRQDKRIYVRFQPPSENAVFKEYNIPANTDPRKSKLYIGSLEYGLKFENNPKHILIQGVDLSLYRNTIRISSGEFITFKNMNILAGLECLHHR